MNSFRFSLCGVLCFSLVALARSASAPLSPEIHSDSTVTFRLHAPGASKVLLNLEGNPHATLAKGADGVWSVTTAALAQDYYGYSFNVDGVNQPDPANPQIRPNLLGLSNMFEVPGSASLMWETRDVPHGRVHHHFYHSAVCGDDRDYYVYTPPGYESAAATTEKYPTLYLLHGFSDDASGWTAVGRANFILDNLIAEGKAKPMVVVMPLGYGTMKIIAAAHSGAGGMRAGGDDIFKQNAVNFQKALLEEIIPRAEKEYRLLEDRRDRAVAGLSMGGGESLQAGLNHPDTFGWVGSFSAGGLSEDLPSQFPAVSAGADGQLELLWIACGKSDGLFKTNEKVRAFLTAKGIHHTDITTSGAHEWMVWRRNLTAFAQLLYK